jgi:glycosyltransferase involved in cell wall biosynthesis
VYIPISQNTWGFLRDGLFVLAACAFSHAAVIIHYHGGDSFVDFRRNADKIMKFFVRFVLARVNVAIVVGESLRGVFGSDVKRVVAVHNGITFTPSLEAHRRRNGQFVRISFLSNLVESKGILDFIEAARIVLRQYSNLQFHIAGAWWNQEPMTRRRVEELTRSPRTDERIHFHGPLSGTEKEKFFLDTDIFVFPTWSDSFGLVILEAMAAGCPVISTRVGAIPEVVVDGVTGILVEKQNPQQLADAIVRLVDDPALRQRMGEAGRKRFEEHYTFERCAERLIKVFEQVLQERSAD